MKRFAVLTFACLLCISLFACSWMEGEHISVKPHQVTIDQPDKNVIEIFNYQELQEALVNLVHDGDETAVLSVAQINQQSVDFYMEAAIRYVKETDAIGAYAVEEISFEQGATAGKPALAVKISYKQDRLQVIRMQRVDTMQDVEQAVTKALADFEQECVVLVRNYQQTDCEKMVRDIARNNPQRIMESPTTAYHIYPESGSERVIQMQFTYKNTETDLRTMQSMVEPVFASAKLYVSGSRTEWEKYTQLYAFLMERHDYKIGASATPSYHLLHYGIGDCDAFAAVYSAMCRDVGLVCDLVSGKKDGQDWSWNRIILDDQVYYLDLLECEEKGGFALKSQADMDRYEWESATEG